jgi:hypothetical protein
VTWKIHQCVLFHLKQLLHSVPTMLYNEHQKTRSLRNCISHPKHKLFCAKHNNNVAWFIFRMCKTEIWIGTKLSWYSSEHSSVTPCTCQNSILKYSCNESQHHALFLNFILVKNCTCFRQTYCPSSGVLILYSQQQVFVILSASEVAVSQHKQYDKYLLLWIQY